MRRGGQEAESLVSILSNVFPQIANMASAPSGSRAVVVPLGKNLLFNFSQNFSSIFETIYFVIQSLRDKAAFIGLSLSARHEPFDFHSFEILKQKCDGLSCGHGTSSQTHLYISVPLQLLTQVIYY